MNTHERFLSPRITISPKLKPSSSTNEGITSIEHPDYVRNISDWMRFRHVYNSDTLFVETYLKKFSQREDDQDFQDRKAITPVPAFAAAAVDEIKNSIFERTSEVVRSGGPSTYSRVCKGELGGVDLAGASMNWFVGNAILPELLALGKVGIFVDNFQIGPTLADKGLKHPFLYIYKTENILSWVTDMSGQYFTKLLLREYKSVLDKTTGLPVDEVESYRFLELTPKGVEVKYYNQEGKEEKTAFLKLKRIPFIVFELSHSLLKHVANHQIALLNLESSDLSYVLKSNFPFYIEQATSGNNDYLRAAQEQARALESTGLESNPQNTGKEQVDVGPTQGRQFTGTIAPSFIAPPTEPLLASMKKQEALKDDVRKLVHLALSTVQPKMASAESKKQDNQSLESGLAYIGLELEHGERLCAEMYAEYEGSNDATTIFYPTRYSLKSDEERRKEVSDLEILRFKVPSLKFQKQITKQIAETLLTSKIADRELEEILKEIDNADFITSDPKTVEADFKNGFVSLGTASKARGYPETEVEEAKKDHADRLARIKEAQSSTKDSNNDMGPARGISDMGMPGDQTSKLEKQGKQKRGQGK